MFLLPSHIILQEIAPFLNDEETIGFSMTNRGCANYLLRLVRRIRIISNNYPYKLSKVLLFLLEDKLESYFQSPNFRNKINTFINNPYQQLKLQIPENFPFPMTVIEPITCEELETTASLLMTSLCDNLKEVHTLKLSYNRFRRAVVDETVLFRSIVQWINCKNPTLILKELIISDYSFSDLPVVLNLKSFSIHKCGCLRIDGLHITAYTNLTLLKLSYLELLDDVSSLDGIYELHLISCPKVHNISCLNHNHKIVIKECYNIIDYSNSFRYSKSILIHAFRRNEGEVNLNFSNLMEVRDFNIGFHRISFKDIVIPLTIPSNNKMKEITIWHCNNISSLLNFHSIYHVKFYSLMINSLEGLGRRNRIVEIDQCHFITDFTPLRHCDKIVIRCCEGFQDVRQLQGIRDFTFSPIDINRLPSNLEGVTCLLLKEIPKDLLSLIFPNSLTKLVFLLSSSFHPTKHIFQLLDGLPLRIVKVEGKAQISETINKCWAMVKKEEVSLVSFHIELINGIIHFLRC